MLTTLIVNLLAAVYENINGLALADSLAADSCLSLSGWQRQLTAAVPGTTQW